MKSLYPLLFMAFLLAGCATQKDFNALKWEVDALKTRVTKAEDKLKEKERLTEQGLGQQAELLAKYTEIQEQVASLQGGLEELKASNKGAVKEERVNALEKQVHDLKASFEAVRKEQSRSPFETGSEKLKAGKYNEAITDFKAYLASNPDPSLVDDVQFLIGEALYSQARYEDAVLQFDLVSKKYPKGDKAADALLKQGMSFYKMDDDETGNLVLERLIQSYPNSDAAAKAKKIMKEGMGKG